MVPSLMLSCFSLTRYQPSMWKRSLTSHGRSIRQMPHSKVMVTFVVSSRNVCTLLLPDPLFCAVDPWECDAPPPITMPMNIAPPEPLTDDDCPLYQLLA